MSLLPLLIKRWDLRLTLRMSVASNFSLPRTEANTGLISKKSWQRVKKVLDLVFRVSLDKVEIL